MVSPWLQQGREREREREGERERERERARFFVIMCCSHGTMYTVTNGLGKHVARIGH